MPMYDIVSLLVVGYGAGILSGMFGIGGGIVIVPALTLLTKLNLAEACGTSLAALMLPVGILGCLVYYKEHLLNIKTALTVALGIITTVGIGAYLANIISLTALQVCYSIFLFYIGFRFINPLQWLRNKNKQNKGADISGAPVDKIAAETEALEFSYQPVKCLLIGALAGLNAGFFGVGGGAIIVPLLCLWLNLSTKRAIATSMGVLLPPIGLPGVLVFYQQGNLNISYALYVAAGLMLGAILGARLTLKLPANFIRFTYGLILILIGIRFTLKML